MYLKIRYLRYAQKRLALKKRDDDRKRAAEEEARRKVKKFGGRTDDKRIRPLCWPRVLQCNRSFHTENERERGRQLDEDKCWPRVLQCNNSFYTKNEREGPSTWRAHRPRAKNFNRRRLAYPAKEKFSNEYFVFQAAIQKSNVLLTRNPELVALGLPKPNIWFSVTCSLILSERNTMLSIQKHNINITCARYKNAELSALSYVHFPPVYL